jgi:CIC family chloride channel protein
MNASPGRSFGARLQAPLLAVMKRFGLFTRAERVFFLLVPVVGIATGLIAVVISTLMNLVASLLWGEGYHILAAAQAASPRDRLLLPLCGGLAIALLVILSGGPIRGEGTSSLIEAVALRGGYVPTGRTLFGQLAAILTVGSGGSLGREGPLLRSGAAFASKIGRSLKLSGNPLKILVGCGTAAGMAAAYNAPVGGAIFAMEVVLGNFALDTFGPIVISSVLATVLSRRYLFPDGRSVYDIPEHTLTSGYELAFFAVMGVLAGGLAVLFIQARSWGDRAFDRLPLPDAAKPVLGFGMVGAIGVFVPYIYGNGFDTVNLALNEDPSLSLWLLLLLPFVKLFATAITAGCGGVGGVFTPSLFVGALLGSAFGTGVHELLPGDTAGPGAYALVGMGAIAAATTHAPIASILIIFEMTQDYSIILPLMAACTMSNVVSRALKKESIFTDRLARRGIRLPHRLEEIVMETMTAKDIVREDPTTLKTTDNVTDILARFMDNRRSNLYVLDDKRRFLGAVSLHDLKQVLQQSQDLGFILAVDVMYPDFPFVTADDRLTRVLEVFATHDYERLPVLADAESRRFTGLISKRDVISVYNQEVLQRPTLLAKFTTDRDEGEETTYVELPPRYRVDQVVVGQGLAGRTLAEVNLPATYQTHVLSLKRLDENLHEYRVIPDGQTRLESGDRLVVLGPLERIEGLKEQSGAAS